MKFETKNIYVDNKKVGGITEIFIEGKRMPKYIFRQLPYIDFPIMKNMKSTKDFTVDLLGFVRDKYIYYIFSIDNQLYRVSTQYSKEVFYSCMDMVNGINEPNRQLYIGA